MAQGAAKQPQQLMKLAYLLAIGQQVDLVINVDGFNEFALGWQNVNAGMDPILPAAQSIGPLLAQLSPAPASEEFYGIARDMLEARRLIAAYSAQADRARSGVGYASAFSLAWWYRMELSKSTSRYDALTKSKDLSNLRPLLSLDLSKSEPGENRWRKYSQLAPMLAANEGALRWDRDPVRPHRAAQSILLPSMCSQRMSDRSRWPSRKTRLPDWHCRRLFAIHQEIRDTEGQPYHFSDRPFR
jgi:hypothetical protein